MRGAKKNGKRGDIFRKKTPSNRIFLTLAPFLTIISIGAVVFAKSFSPVYISHFDRFVASRVRFDGDAPDKRSRALADEPIFFR